MKRLHVKRPVMWAIVGLILCGFGVLMGLEYPGGNLKAQVAKKFIPELVEQFRAAGDVPQYVAVYVNAPKLSDAAREEIKALTMEQLGATPVNGKKGRIMMGVLGTGRNVTVHLAYLPLEGQPKIYTRTDKVFLWESVLVPLVAIVLALLFQKIVLALGVGIIAGAFLAHPFEWMAALKTLGVTYIWGTVSEISHLYIYGFTLLLLCMVGVMTGSGGMSALMRKLTMLAKSARATKLTAFLMGIVVFFDDYANTIIVGSSMRSFFHKAKLSRAKLAYIIDSTAAPVAGLAIFSTWVAYEVSQLDGVFAAQGLSYDGFVTLLSALPFRFYCLFTLVFVFINIWTGRNYGQMRISDMRAHETHAQMDDLKDPDESTHPASSFWIALLPLIGIVIGMPLALIYDGVQATDTPLSGLGVGDWLRTTLGNADSPKVLMLTSAFGLILAGVLSFVFRAQRAKDIVISAYRGGLTVIPALIILTLAWAIQLACSDVGVAQYLMALIGPTVSIVWIAPVVFLISAAVSFATGTSFGTMALIIPMAVPLAFALGDGVMLACIVASVLDGAIFGDHCSPISDTTLMSSIASSCDHMEHVHTQMPYAFTVMGVALLIGYIPAGFGMPAWGSWVMGVAVIALIIRYLGKPTVTRTTQSQLKPLSTGLKPITQSGCSETELRV